MQKQTATKNGNIPKLPIQNDCLVFSKSHPFLPSTPHEGKAFDRNNKHATGIKGDIEDTPKY